MKKTILILVSLLSLNLSAQDTTHVSTHIDTCNVTIYDTVTYINWQYDYIVVDTFTIYKVEYTYIDTFIYETIYDTVIVYHNDPLSIEQQTFQPERILVKTINTKGQIVTNRPRNVVLIDVYSDGSIKKYIIR